MSDHINVDVAKNIAVVCKKTTEETNVVPETKDLKEAPENMEVDAVKDLIIGAKAEQQQNLVKEQSVPDNVAECSNKADDNSNGVEKKENAELDEHLSISKEACTDESKTVEIKSIAEANEIEVKSACVSVKLKASVDVANTAIETAVSTEELSETTKQVEIIEPTITNENSAPKSNPTQIITVMMEHNVHEEGNDSQESLGLVIDEKCDEQEPHEASEHEDSNAGRTASDTDELQKSHAKDEKKDSCEDISEVSVVTQIDASEAPLSHADGDDDNADKSEDDLKDDVEIVETVKTIIEIDDDDDDDEDAAQESNEASLPAASIDTVKVPESKQENVTVIEIDDDDDMPAVPVLKSEQQVEEQHEKVGSEAIEATVCPKTTSEVGAMDIDSEIIEQPQLSTSISNENEIEMKDTTNAATEIAPPADADCEVNRCDDGTLLQETTMPKAASPPMPSSSSSITDEQIPVEDGSAEIFYNKECINYECPRNHKQYLRVPQFALSYFKVSKKKFKVQYICAECYDKALDMYEDYCGLLTAKQPLLLKDVVCGRQEFVEIIDSSDEEDTEDKAEKDKVPASFSKNDLELIENELENSIKSMLANVEIQNQLTWSKTILATRAKRLQAETEYIDAELRMLQKKADHMHVSLYQCPRIKIRQLQPLDLNSGRPFGVNEAELNILPPVGEIGRPAVQVNETYYAVKNKAIASWVPCKVIEQVDSTLVAQKNLKHYKIKFLKSQYQMVKTVSVKHLAYYDPPNVRLMIGTRVIAYFDATSLTRGKEKLMIQSAFYPGIIAEPLKPQNKYRYLIFYDDGYTQYVYHKDVRLVCHVSENVWEDVHPASRDFIQKYLTQYSINRPMVQTQKGQSMTTESNGKWIYARVVDIDCSLIQMQFEGPKSHTEWIYRGSLRLGPVFKEYQKTLQKSALPISRLPRRTEPFIRYTEDEEASTNQQINERTSEARAVAKKSVSRQDSASNSATQLQTQTAPPIVRHLNNSTIYLEDENKPKGKVVYYTAKRNLPPLAYKEHKCSPDCLFKITHNLSAYSPLSKPLLSGWERLIIRQKIKRVVTYRAPCGKMLRNMKELRNYLRVTNNVLNVDNFDFYHETNCLAEYVIESAIVQKRDISGGQEKMAIPLVNYYDSTMPPECKYAAQRIPTEGVNLNLDEEFLVGCDCDDDCSDKTKCSCWQLTYAGAKYGNPNTPVDEIGYQYKRLYEHVPTGIYECNSRCKCKSNCLNRVVQASLQMKLQVFKTSNRGWGLRCINDVPRGSFICIYAGHLLTEAKANEGGLDAGDEYFAELDYIEVAEQIKEGYESDVEPPELEEEEDTYAPDDDDEFQPSKSFLTRSKRLQRSITRGPQNGDEDSQERQVINFNPNADMSENSMRETSIRQLFGKDEACYVMDAKTIGNLGRYFNHSCSPNLFVQNVFVDTHDLRFPWVAFFASTHIRAGTELTWNYNYEVGVVPGKVLYCQCGAPNCRLRLL